MTGEEFARLVEPHRAELQAHCYRMLGSLHDAEDALQEALLRAWRGMPDFEGRGSLRAWLYRIATNTCLRALERRSRRVLPVDYGPPADPADGPGTPLLESVWVEPFPDAGVAAGLAGPEARYELRESVELAFVAALQHLPPRQRAVLILREVLGFSAAEVAEALETTPAAVYSALQRAHRTVDEHLPATSQQAALRTLGDRRVRELVDAYVSAWERNDVGAVAALLARDAIIAMPPMPTWLRGRDHVTAFLAEWPLSGGRRWRLVPTGVNGQLGFQHFSEDGPGGPPVAHGVTVLTLRGDRVAEMTTYLTPAVVGRFAPAQDAGTSSSRWRTGPTAASE